MTPKLYLVAALAGATRDDGSFGFTAKFVRTVGMIAGLVWIGIKGGGLAARHDAKVDAIAAENCYIETALHIPPGPLCRKEKEP